MKNFIRKTYAIETAEQCTRRYVLIKELWYDDKLMQFDYEYSDELKKGYELKNED